MAIPKRPRRLGGLARRSLPPTNRVDSRNLHKCWNKGDTMIRKLFPKWFKNWSQHRRPIRVAGRRIKPVLEALENRLCPSTVPFAGPVNYDVGLGAPSVAFGDFNG